MISVSFSNANRKWHVSYYDDILESGGMAWEMKLNIPFLIEIFEEGSNQNLKIASEDSSYAEYQEILSYSNAFNASSNKVSFITESYQPKLDVKKAGASFMCQFYEQYIECEIFYEDDKVQIIRGYKKL